MNNPPKELNVGHATVSRWLKKEGIPIRSRSESKLPEGVERLSKKKLERLYIEEEKSTIQIARDKKISTSTVNAWLKYHKIPIRTISESKLPEGVERLSKKELERLYIEEEKSTIQIGKELNVNRATVSKLLKGYGIPIRGSERIKSREQFMDFLKGDETARNLAVASIGLNGEGYDVEQILIEIYNGKFKDQDQLHRLLEEAENEIYELVDEGVTNLGSYLGGFSLGDRRIFPLLLGEALANIPEERISQPLEERLTRILRVTYSPRFNDNPTGILEELKGKIDSSDGKIKVLYEKLYGHYEDVLELGDELKC